MLRHPVYISVRTGRRVCVHVRGMPQVATLSQQFLPRGWSCMPACPVCILCVLSAYHLYFQLWVHLQLDEAHKDGAAAVQPGVRGEGKHEEERRAHNPDGHPALVTCCNVMECYALVCMYFNINSRLLRSSDPTYMIYRIHSCWHWQHRRALSHTIADGRVSFLVSVS